MKRAYNITVMLTMLDQYIKIMNIVIMCCLDLRTGALRLNSHADLLNL